MSAIGVSVLQDGEIVQSFSTLVHPECRFERFHIALTGITPERAAQAPTFPQLWAMIEPIFSRGILVAHNAAFDLSVLSHCLRDYGIEWKPETEYLCTCRVGRKLLPEAPNHRLDTLCQWYGIPLDHHQAGSDANACAALLLEYQKTGADLKPFVRTYDMICGCTRKH